MILIWMKSGDAREIIFLLWTISVYRIDSWWTRPPKQFSSTSPSKTTYSKFMYNAIIVLDFWPVRLVMTKLTILLRTKRRLFPISKCKPMFHGSSTVQMFGTYWLVVARCDKTFVLFLILVLELKRVMFHVCLFN